MMSLHQVDGSKAEISSIGSFEELGHDAGRSSTVSIIARSSISRWLHSSQIAFTMSMNCSSNLCYELRLSNSGGYSSIQLCTFAYEADED